METPAGSWLGPLKMHQDGQGTMTFQPKRAPGVKVPSIVFDLKLGTVKVVQLPFLPGGCVACGQRHAQALQRQGGWQRLRAALPCMP